LLSARVSLSLHHGILSATFDEVSQHELEFCSVQTVASRLRGGDVISDDCLDRLTAFD